ncbi:DUF6115 domain-containing protein [Marinitoga litoralis]|jgi:hypothetical protein|uniref:DUF6115 domain-containing protein n=1 Tax=Marinitoga litoralis TaxID=570855 RepID=UPI00196088E0|nr:hypothetical protein [Marinitoga litoralis]MBM7560197.1 DNA-binding transcriptional MerR regulator [Marinitoga litoralis]
MVYLIIFIWLIILSVVSLINLSLLISLWRKFNNFSITIDSSIEDQSNTLLARFQKITSSRLRALDNKIELLDQLIKDADEVYMKSFSMLTDLEKKNDEIKRVNNKKQNNRTIDNSNFSKFDSNNLEMPIYNENEFKKSNYYNSEKKFNNVNEYQELQNTFKEDKKEKSPEQLLKEKIIEQYKKGMSINEIAKMLDKGSGEIKLIIDLYYNENIDNGN